MAASKTHQSPHSVSHLMPHSSICSNLRQGCPIKGQTPWRDSAVTQRLSSGREMPNISSSSSSSIGTGIRSNGQHEMSKPNDSSKCSFQMPLHYPRYQKRDYEEMPEWKLDRLLTEYGLPVSGDVNQKRRFAMGAFLWPSQYE